jgi:hypothetical protein
MITSINVDKRGENNQRPIASCSRI